MPVKRSALVGLATMLFLGTAAVHAQPRVETMEVAVNGPPGALLLMDGQAMGTLPLQVNVNVPTGSHRFTLQLGTVSAASDPLSFSGSGQAELNLTLAGRSLVAVLRTTDGLLLLLEPEALSASARSALYDSVSRAASAKHSVLLTGEKEQRYSGRSRELIRCIHEAQCADALFVDGQVSYVLSVRIDSGTLASSPSCRLRTTLLDARTRDVSAQADTTASPCSETGVSTQLADMTSRLLQETALRPRGNLTVSSTPPGAKVRVDGRLLGTTPFQQEVFAGTRAIEVRKDKYLPYQSSTQVEPNQTASIETLLQRDPSAQLSRPLWRIVTGSILLGGGLLMAGFGTSALMTNGQCQDGSVNLDTCSPYYSTTAVGAGLLGGGGALAITGVLMLAIPSK